MDRELCVVELLWFELWASSGSYRGGVPTANRNWRPCLCRSQPLVTPISLCKRTQEINFERKTNKIAEFSILDEIFIHYFGRNLHKKWPIDRRRKLSNSFTFVCITIMLLQLGWKNGCLELLGCKWINFLSQNEGMHRTAGTTSWHQSFGAYH